MLFVHTQRERSFAFFYSLCHLSVSLIEERKKNSANISFAFLYFAHRSLVFSFGNRWQRMKINHKQMLGVHVKSFLFFSTILFTLFQLLDRWWRHLKKRSFVFKKSRDERFKSFQFYATISSNMARSVIRVTVCFLHSSLGDRPCKKW